MSLPQGGVVRQGLTLPSYASVIDADENVSYASVIDARTRILSKIPPEGRLYPETKRGQKELPVGA